MAARLRRTCRFMPEEYQLLYSNLLSELIIHQQLPVEIDRVTACFWTSRQHWKKLMRQIGEPVFDNTEKEIIFFKYVKPRFTSHIEYYTLLSDALMAAVDARKEPVTFWEGEARRFNLFCEKYAEFIAYYNSQSQHLDHLYFQRRKETNCQEQLLLYDTEPGWSASHDNLARRYLARKMYWETCHYKIRENTS